jgi:hypothetical protein
MPSPSIHSGFRTSQTNLKTQLQGKERFEQRKSIQILANPSRERVRDHLTGKFFWKTGFELPEIAMSSTVAGLGNAGVCPVCTAKTEAVEPPGIADFCVIPRM